MRLAAAIRSPLIRQAGRNGLRDRSSGILCQVGDTRRIGRPACVSESGNPPPDAASRARAPQPETDLCAASRIVSHGMV